MKKALKTSELSAESQAFYDEIVKDFGINDRGGLETLRQAAQCLDRIREARVILKKDGLIIKDRWQQKRPHPAHKVEADSRASFVSCLRLLGLDGSTELGGK